MNVFETKESNVRSYCRNFPVIFDKAKNAELFSNTGQRYIDFFSGAGAMNFGHNNPYIKEKVIEYIMKDSIMHGLDMYTVAKGEFITTLYEKILDLRKLDYKIMFCGSTGTNAVEAALKLARKNKQRSNIFAFSGAFHGMSLGSLALTTDLLSRAGAGTILPNVTFIPYFNALKTPQDSLDYVDWILTDDHSGVDKPAAIFLETVQAEGGINVAPAKWLQGIREICDKHDILLICDDIQVGIYRTGTFFSFERADIVPDMVILSKSISAYGLPMSVVLLRPELDIFKPAEHNGTFRGNQLAFIGAAAGIDYTTNNDMALMVKERERIILDYLTEEILALDNRLSIRGIGMIWGIDFSDIDSALSKTAMQECVRNHLILERAGRGDCVLKILPPLTIEKEVLMEGLNIIKKVVTTVLAKESNKQIFE